MSMRPEPAYKTAMWKVIGKIMERIDKILEEPDQPKYHLKDYELNDKS